MQINLETLRTNRLELGIPLKGSPYHLIFRDRILNPKLDWQLLPSFKSYCELRYAIRGTRNQAALVREFNIKWPKFQRYLDLPGCLIYQKSGKYYILEGHHRLGLALAKGMKSIAINHLAQESSYLHWQKLSGLDYPNFNPSLKKDWQELCNDAFRIYGMKKLYHSVPVSCFKGWILERNDGRVQIIKQACTGALRILDLGCHIGGISFAVFHNNRVVGVDNSAHAIRVAKKLTFALDKPIIFFHQDILNFLRKPPSRIFNHFDIIICASILHHIRRASEKKFNEILPLLSARGSKLIFDYAEKGEATIFPEKLKLSPEDIKRIILANTKFKRAEAIGLDAQFKRHLFLFQ